MENGHRPPTARIAAALDGVFTEHRGWYLTWLEETRTAPEIPVTFRSWSDYEDRTAALRVWTPGIVDGQRRVLGRDKPPAVTLLVDEAALYRQVGTAEVMAAQLCRLREVAALPAVVMQVMPEVAHASVASGYLIADDAVWCENVITGGTCTDPETVTAWCTISAGACWPGGLSCWGYRSAARSETSPATARKVSSKSSRRPR